VLEFSALSLTIIYFAVKAFVNVDNQESINPRELTIVCPGSLID